MLAAQDAKVEALEEELPVSSAGRKERPFQIPIVGSCK